MWRIATHNGTFEDAKLLDAADEIVRYWLDTGNAPQPEPISIHFLAKSGVVMPISSEGVKCIVDYIHEEVKKAENNTGKEGNHGRI